MKKIVALIIVLLILVGCGSTGSNKLEVTPKEASALFENKEDFVLVMGSSSCSGCIVYKPRLQEVLNNKQGVKLVYVEMDTANKEHLVDFVENALQQTVTVTPTTYFVKGGVVEDSFVGDRSYTDLVNTLVRKGYISE